MYLPVEGTAVTRPVESPGTLFYFDVLRIETALVIMCLC
jgi:hypothetical protein